jgi:hypothetical protein
VLITDKNGKTTTVDKTWQFFKDDNGKLRIILHHSSLPYTGKYIRIKNLSNLKNVWMDFVDSNVFLALIT